jgi:putative SOS response-associated peptidase YedK
VGEVCGRYAVVSDLDDVGRLFAVDDLEVTAGELPPNPNVAPTETVPAVLEHHHRRRLVGLRWGLIPSWATDRRIANRLINARSETVLQRPAFRAALRYRRCLLPADGYYEWWREADGSRTPYLLAPPDRSGIALAGLWENWQDPQGERVSTCTILTTSAAPGLAWLHDRMPVVLAPDAWDEWLDRDNQDLAALRHLLQPAPDGLLRTTRAPVEVNDPRNKDVALPTDR